MYSNNEVTIPINNLPTSLNKLQDIYHIERTYTYREIEIDNKNYVQHIDTIKKEKLFVIGNEKIMKELPSNCKLFRKLPRDEQYKLDIKRCITYTYLHECSLQLNTIQPDYIPDTSSNYYMCQHTIKHIYCRYDNNSHEILQYELSQKDVNIDKTVVYFIATNDELCTINIDEFTNIQHVEFKLIPPHTTVYQYDELASIPKHEIGIPLSVPKFDNTGDAKHNQFLIIASANKGCRSLRFSLRAAALLTLLYASNTFSSGNK